MPSNTKAKPEATEAPETEEIKRVPPTLNRRHISTIQSARTHWFVNAPAGTLPGDLLLPPYWRHVRAEMRIQAGDRVEALCDDGLWWADYLVIHCGEHEATLHILNEVELETISEDDLTAGDLKVTWISPSLKYGVVRISDKHRLQTGFPSKSLAAVWMHQNMASGRAA